MTKYIVLGLFALWLPLTAVAGANVALHVKVAGIKISNKALNHPEYQAVELSGVITRSDSFVDDMPEVLPERVAILIKADNAGDKFLAGFCKKAALIAKKTGDSLRIDIFMQNPNDLPKLIEGGMKEMRFNEFVLRADDEQITSISCSLGN